MNDILAVIDQEILTLQRARALLSAGVEGLKTQKRGRPKGAGKGAALAAAPIGAARKNKKAEVAQKVAPKSTGMVSKFVAKKTAVKKPAGAVAKKSVKAVKK